MMPIQYLIQTKDGFLIHVGDFYRTDNKDADDQFPLFCKLFEYPPDFTRYLVNTYLEEGGTFYALEFDGTLITLAESDFECGCIFGKKETIKFLGYEFVEAA